MESTIDELEYNVTNNKTLRILIVEDEHSIAYAIQTILKHNNYDSYIVNDVNDLASTIASYQPNLITMDLDIPGFNGFDAIDFIRSADDNKIPILVVSGLSEDYLKKALKKGADDYLAKPFDNKKLVAKCEELIKK